ncbi:MAG TPA: hypothetical protein VGV68_04605 [Terriglobia bacterium]|nr:hypothetical protein [Terriglobia bacterium]
MKISLNLATVSSARERYAIFWAAPVALIGAIGLVALVYAAIFNFREYHKIQTNLGRLSQKEKDLTGREKALQKELDQPSDREVFQKAHFVNDLIQQRQLTLTRLTQKVSRLIPPTVRLTALGVTHSKEGIVVRFSVLGRDEGGVETFMGNLEDSPDFTDLTVTNQKFEQVATTPGQVSITCTARYVGDGAH